MASMQKISPCFWFDNQAEAAAEFYCSIFPDSKIVAITRYGEAGHEIHGQEAGAVMTVTFELCGHRFTGLNGGPIFKFSEAVSFQINCDTQDEVDYYWEKLGAGADEAAQQCGWLKDKFGLSWQVIPVALFDLVGDPNSEKSQRATTAMLQMKKLDIDKLQQAYDG